jgi:hypothetical protein
MIAAFGGLESSIRRFQGQTQLWVDDTPPLWFVNAQP